MKKSSAKQIKVKPFPVGIEEIYRMSLELENRADQVLYNTLYLTGARISEVLDLRKFDFKLIERTGGRFYYVRLKALKNPHLDEKQAVIKADNPKKPEESEMLKPIERHLDTLEIGEKLFNIRREAYYYRIRHLKFNSPGTHRGVNLDVKTFHMFPHFLRGCRLTHLWDYYKMDPIHLQAIAGHSDMRSIWQYVHSKPDQIADAMSR